MRGKKGEKMERNHRKSWAESGNTPTHTAFITALRKHSADTQLLQRATIKVSVWELLEMFVKVWLVIKFVNTLVVLVLLINHWSISEVSAECKVLSSLNSNKSDCKLRKRAGEIKASWSFRFILPQSTNCRRSQYSVLLFLKLAARFLLIFTFLLLTNDQRLLSSWSLDCNINGGCFLDWLSEGGGLYGHVCEIVCVYHAF